MQEKIWQKKSLKDLKKGDIIHMCIPFEENTTDYYNGYRPQEIRGRLYTNRDGQTSKSRYVVVIGHDDESIQYLPLTSRRSGFDESHQYELEDNSMTYKKDPDMKSYVEIDSLRSIYVDPNWNIHYQGRIMENDMVNIMVKLGRRSLDFDSDRDQRVYVSRNKEITFNRQLTEHGYSLLNENETQKTYGKEDGRTITKTRYGLVKYHVPLSKEDVTKLIAQHEGKPVNFYKGIRPEDDFSKAIAKITENRLSESEVI